MLPCEQDQLSTLTQSALDLSVSGWWHTPWQPAAHQCCAVPLPLACTPDKPAAGVACCLAHLPTERSYSLEAMAAKGGTSWKAPASRSACLLNSYRMGSLQSLPACSNKHHVYEVQCGLWQFLPVSDADEAGLLRFNILRTS